MRHTGFPRLFPGSGSGARWPAGVALWTGAVAVLLVSALGSLGCQAPRAQREARKAFSLSCAHPGHGCIEVSNAGPETARFNLSLNGRPFVESVAEISREASALPDEYPGEPPYRKVWRYTRSQVVLSRPVSDRRWYEHPCLLVNSTGFGFCDDMATMNCLVWRELGFKSRCWRLSEHVVSEVFVDGRWEMYDSDIGVCYLRPDGKVAGVEELAAHPDWVQRSAMLLSPLTQRTREAAQSPATAAIYARRTDMAPFDQPMPDPLPFEIVLPPGGRLAFPLAPEAAGVQDHYGDGAGSPAESAFLRIGIPSGWSGPMPTPLILHSVSGAGQIGHEGRWHAPESPSLRNLLNSRFPPHAGVEVRAAGELWLLYYVNPRRFRLHDENELVLSGRGIGGCRARVAPPGGPSPAPSEKEGPGR